MKKVLLWLASCFFVSASISAYAGEQGSAEEAKALVKKAVAYYKANGKEKALAEFSNGKGQFIDRDLYIFAVDQTGKNVASGAQPKIIGKLIIDLKDPDGKHFVRDFIKVANEKGYGWVDYKWPNPVTTVVENKSTYVEKVDDIVIGCGIYK